MKPQSPIDVSSVRGLRDPVCTRGGALPDRVEQAGAEESVLGRAVDYIERAGSVFEDTLQHLDRLVQRAYCGKWAKDFRAFVLHRVRFAGDKHTRKIVLCRDHEIRECFAVGQAGR